MFRQLHNSNKVIASGIIWLFSYLETVAFDLGSKIQERNRGDDVYERE